MSDVKYCCDCRFFRRDFCIARCTSPHVNRKVKEIDLVFGEIETEAEFVTCQNQRELGSCGKEAKYFEKRKSLLERIKNFFNAKKSL